MTTFWFYIGLAFVVLVAFLPDDAAIFFDLVEIWFKTAWVWIRAKMMMMAGLWLRLKWDASGVSWRLWRIRQRMRYNSLEKQPTEGETKE
jgi:hypothetical protein